MPRLLHPGPHMQGLERALQKMWSWYYISQGQGRETEAAEAEGILRLQNCPTAQPVVPVLGGQAESPSLRTRLGKSEFMPTHASVHSMRQNCKATMGAPEVTLSPLPGPSSSFSA